MKIGDCVTRDGLRTSLVLLGIGLLTAACGGGGGGSGDQMPEGAMPGNGGGPMVTQLGEWDVPMPGGLDVSDANSLLRAYYDSSGGHVVPDAPVQPEGTGTATWTGMWSGNIDVDPVAALALSSVGVDASDLQRLSGNAVVTAYFENNGVEADLTYEDIGLDEFGLSELTSDRVPVTGGTFQPTVTHTLQIPAITATGTFTGEGAFGGANAEGVAGYIGGGISAPELGGQLGTFNSVFYGDKVDTN